MTSTAHNPQVFLFPVWNQEKKFSFDNLWADGYPDLHSSDPITPHLDKYQVYLVPLLLSKLERDNRLTRMHLCSVQTE